MVGLLKLKTLRKGYHGFKNFSKVVIQKVKQKITDISGVVSDIVEEEGRRYTVTIKNDIEERSYLTEYGQQLRVKKGDHIKNGERITEGAIHPRELLAASNVTAVQNYILNEVQKSLPH